MKILVAVDLADSTEKVVAEAQQMAKKLEAELVVLHVADPEPEFVGYEPGPQTVRDSVAGHLHKEHAEVQAVAAQLRDTGLKATALLIQGTIAQTIVKEAKKLAVDMVIMGTHGRSGVKEWLLGSVSDGVLQRSDCPVLVVPTHRPD